MEKEEERDEQQEALLKNPDADGISQEDLKNNLARIDEMSKLKFNDVATFKLYRNRYTHEQLAKMLARTEFRHFLTSMNAKNKIKLLELQLQESNKLAQSLSKHAPEEYVVQSVGKYLRDSRRKGIDKRRVVKEIVEDLLRANKLTLPAELDDLLYHLDDLRDGEAVNVALPSPPQSHPTQDSPQQPTEVEEPSRNERIKAAIIQMKGEGCFKHKYDYYFIKLTLEKELEKGDRMTFTNRSFADYLADDLGLDHVCSEDNLKKIDQNTWYEKGGFNWTFTDKGTDHSEQQRRINIGKRFYNLYNGK